MLHGRNRIASDRLCKRNGEGPAKPIRRFRCQDAPRLGERDLPHRGRLVEGQDIGGVDLERTQVRLEGPDVTPRDRSRQRRANPERPRVAQRLLDEPPVDGERPGLVEPGDPPELGDRVEQCHEAARGQDCGGVISRLRPRRETDRDGSQRLGHLAEQGCQLLFALDGDRRAVQSRDRALRVGEGDEGMERADLRPSGHRRGENLGAEETAGMDQGLAGVEPEGAREGGDRVVGNGEQDQLDLVEQRVRLGEGAGAGDQVAEAGTPFGIAARDRRDRPARPHKRHSESSADRTRADDPDDRVLARFGVGMGMRVVMGVGAVAVAVLTGSLRVELDALPFELLERPAPIRVTRRLVRPGPHRGTSRYSCTS